MEVDGGVRGLGAEKVPVAVASGEQVRNATKLASDTTWQGTCSCCQTRDSSHSTWRSWRLKWTLGFREREDGGGELGVFFARSRAV